MSIEAVKETYAVLDSVVRHFGRNVNNKKNLDKCMRILEMKEVHLISWCGTQMAHFLDAGTLFSVVVMAVYDVMCSHDIKVEERDALFSCPTVFLLLLMADINGFYKGTYLHKVDRDDIVLSEVYRIAITSSEAIKTTKLYLMQLWHL